MTQSANSACTFSYIQCFKDNSNLTKKHLIQKIRLNEAIGQEDTFLTKYWRTVATWGRALDSHTKKCVMDICFFFLNTLSTTKAILLSQ